MKQGWEIKNIGSIADITDYVANGSFATLRENVSYLNEEGYAILVRLADFTNGFDSSKFVYIDEHAYNFLAKSKLYGGEIIMSNVGSIGKCFKCPDLNKPMSLAPNSIVIRTPNNDFYHYVFQSFYFQSEVKRISSQTALPKFNKTSFKNINVPVPPCEEQERIVEELDCLSGVIEKKKQQLKELDALAESIFFTMFGDPITNEKGWEVKKVIDVVKMQRGFDLPMQDRDDDGVIPIYGSNGIIGYHTIHKADFGIITGRSGTLGEVYSSNEPFWPLNTTLFSVDTHGNNIIFLKYMMANFHLERFKAGAGVPTLNRNEFHNEPIPNIPLTLQQEFAEKIEAIEKQKELIKKSIEKTEILFNSRMDYYFN